MTAQHTYHIYNNLDFWKRLIDEYLLRKEAEGNFKKRKRKKKTAA